MSDHIDDNGLKRGAAQKFQETLPICFAAVGGATVVVSGLLVASLPYPELAVHMAHSFIGCVVAFLIVFGVAISAIFSGDHALVKSPFLRKPTHVFFYAICLALLISVGSITYALMFVGEVQFLIRECSVQ